MIAERLLLNLADKIALWCVRKFDLHKHKLAGLFDRFIKSTSNENFSIIALYEHFALRVTEENSASVNTDLAFVCHFCIRAFQKQVI